MADKEYGKFLKKLRIDRELLLQEMANSLHIKASYLSAIESGNRDIPAGLTDSICATYALSDEQRQELHEAEVNAERKTVYLNIEGIKDNRLAKETVLNFAGKFATLTDEQLQKINDILNKGASL